MAKTTVNAAATTIPEFLVAYENDKKTLVPVGLSNGLLHRDDCMSHAYESYLYAVKHFKPVIGKNGSAVEFQAYFRTCYSSLLLRNTDPSTRPGNAIFSISDDNEDAPAFDMEADQPGVGDDPDIEGWRMADCDELIEKSRHYGAEIHALVKFFCAGNSVAAYAELHGITARTVERIIADFNKKVFDKPSIATTFGQGSLFSDHDVTGV